MVRRSAPTGTEGGHDWISVEGFFSGEEGILGFENGFRNDGSAHFGKGIAFGVSVWSGVGVMEGTGLFWFVELENAKGSVR
jgi:hypothetical protein